ncbi:MAG: hypothetical protein ACFFED_03030 [Candidatus Thorarchaeota archaeon]
MKSSCNCVVCLGFLLIAGGGIAALYAAPLLFQENAWLSLFGGDDTLLVLLVGIVVAIVGLSLVYSGFASAKNWNRVVAIAKSQNQITLKEISVKSGIPIDKVSGIVYDAIGSGELSGTIQGDTFNNSRPAAMTHATEAKVLVICPYCGAKTEQGLAKCQKCGASL